MWIGFGASWHDGDEPLPWSAHEALWRALDSFADHVRFQRRLGGVHRLPLPKDMHPVAGWRIPLTSSQLEVAGSEASVTKESPMPLAVITGASRGLGAALATALDQRGWDLVVDARHPDALPDRRPVTGCRATSPTPATARSWPTPPRGSAAPTCSSTTPARSGRARCPRSRTSTADMLSATLATNVVAPHALTRLLLPQLLAHRGTVLNLTSDASVEPYEGWAAYGSSKAALDHLTRILAAEQPTLRVYAVDPGDMRTRMHQDAFPGEDISDRPDAATVVPHLLALLDGDLPSGRLPRGRRRRCGRTHDLASPSTCPRPGEADSPPESRGLARDEVRMLVAAPGRLEHRRVRDLPEALAPRRPAGGQHLRDAAGRGGPARRRPVPARLHAARRRRLGRRGPPCRQHRPVRPPTTGAVLRLPGGVDLHVPRPAPRRAAPALAGAPRAGDRPDDVPHRARPPGRYPYVEGDWPLAARQNVYAEVPGSAEMPSAGRPLTDRLLVRLMARGVVVAPIVLHTGVSSQETHEPPQPEQYVVPAATARLVASTRAAGTTGRRRRHDGRARPGDGGRRRAAGCTPRPAGRPWCSVPTGPPASSTAC